MSQLQLEQQDGARQLAQKWEKQNKLTSIHFLLLLDLIGTKDTKFYNYGIHFQSRTHLLFKDLSAIEDELRQSRLLYVHSIYDLWWMFRINNWPYISCVIWTGKPNQSTLSILSSMQWLKMTTFHSTKEMFQCCIWYQVSDGSIQLMFLLYSFPWTVLKTHLAFVFHQISTIPGCMAHIGWWLWGIRYQHHWWSPDNYHEVPAGPIQRAGMMVIKFLLFSIFRSKLQTNKTNQ